MSYYDQLTDQQKRNIQLIVAEAQRQGITNPYAIAGMLAIVSKESSFIPQMENLNYSAKRMVEVFKISPEKATQLAGKPEAIANYMYGVIPYGKRTPKDAGGNILPDDGWRFRGRGFNQLTFRGNYDKFGKLIGKDLVSNPDLVNDPLIASKVLVAYNKVNIEELKKRNKLASYNAKDINDFKNTRDAVLAFYHATAGAGKDVSYVKGLQTSDTLGGMTKALARVDDLLRGALNKTGEIISETGEVVKKNPLTTILVTTLAVVATWTLIKYSGLFKGNKFVQNITN